MTDDMLPGLEPAPRAAGALELATRKTLAALERDGLLEDRHAMTCQLMIELAQSVTAGRLSGRASAVAMAAAQLREAFESLPAPEGDDSDSDPFTALANELREAALRNLEEHKPAQ